MGYVVKATGTGFGINLARARRGGVQHLRSTQKCDRLSDAGGGAGRGRQGG
jgi:hypothetical protein